MEAWAFLSRAIFQAKKTYMIHFICNKARLKDFNADVPLKIRDQSINPSFKVKILEIVFDTRLQYHSYVAQACKRSTNAVLALKRLKNLRPEIIHQLFSSAVAPFIDYTLVIWVPNSTKSLLAS